MIESLSDLAPSSLADVIASVIAMFRKAGNATPILTDEFHLTGNQGNPPRIVFVPEIGGSLGDAIVTGHAASWYHSCDVIVRAKPGMREEDRYTHAYALADKVIAALAIAASGRIEWGSCTSDNLTKDDKLGGVGIRFSFTFRRDIAHWDELWNLPAAETDTSKPISSPQDLGAYTPAGPGETPESEIATATRIIPTTAPVED